MSNPILAEKFESSSKSRRRELKMRERKMWKKPIKISRLPSFGFSGSDFTTDQIPVIFSGYTAESEDSSSSEISDDSRTYSKSSDENEEIDQAKSKSVRRRASFKKLKSLSRISSMKVLRRQSTRKISMGGQRLKNMRSMKRLTSNSRQSLKQKNLDSISSDDIGLLEPHYLRPTSSSASKNVEKIQKNLGVARLKRMSSLRYNGLLKATCSSAMKGSSSKKSNHECNYGYCSLHGRRHSHGADNSVTVPSLKRFVSMRRKFLKRQKSLNRRLVLLKRSLSRKRGSLGGGIVTDQESNQVDDDNVDGESNQDVFEEEISTSENDSESNVRSSETVIVDVDDNVDEGMDSMDSKPEIMDDVTGLDHDDEKLEGPKSEETVEDNEAVFREGSSGEMQEEDVMKFENIPNEKEYKPEIIDDSYGKFEGTKSEETVEDDEEVCRESSSGEMQEDDGKKVHNVRNEKDSKPEFMDDSDQKVEGTKSEETMEDNDKDRREEDQTNTENVWNDTINLVKQAFDEILAEITDDSSDENVEADSSDSTSLDMQPIEERDKHLSVIVSTSHIGEESDHRGPKKWSYLKRVILLKRFLKSLDRKERHKLSNGEENETMRLRKELVGERKNAEEWMLDHALRQVISTLAPSQKKKVKHLVKAFESLVPMDGDGGGGRVHDGNGRPDREENETDNKDTTDLEETKLTSEADFKSLDIGVKSEEAFESLVPLDGGGGSRGHDGPESRYREENETEDKDTTDLEETKLTSEASSSLAIVMKSDEALESKEDSSSSHHLDGSDLEEEEKTEDSEKQNLSTWRNLIQKQMVMRKCNETEKEQNWSYGTDQTTGIKEDDDAEERQSSAVKSFQKAFETILSEIPDEEIVSESSKSVKEEKKDQGETKRSWNSLRKVILLKRFVKSMEKVMVFKPRKSRNLPLESELEVENVLLRSTMERIRTDGDEFMLDYALRLAISRLAPIQRKKVDLLVQAFDTVLDGHEAPKDETGEERTQRVEEDCEINKDEERIKTVFSRFQVHQNDLKDEEEVDSTLKESRNLLPPKDETVEEGTPRVEEDCEINKDEQRINNVFSRFQVHRKDLKDEEEVDSTPKESRNLLPRPPPIRNVKEKDSRLWKLIYKHMVTEKEETNSAKSKSVASLEDECSGRGDGEASDLQIDARMSSTVTFVREALEKILSEIPDNSSDDQSIDSEESITFKPKSTEKKVKGWNNVKKVILLKRFVSDLGNLTRLSPKTPRVLPWEPDPETEKIRLRHQEIGEKRNSEEWMLDYALRQAISTLAPSQRRKVSLLAQAFDTISLQDIGNCSTPGSAVSSRNISRQSSISSVTNEGNDAEILRGRLRNLQEDLKETTKINGCSTPGSTVASRNISRQSSISWETNEGNAQVIRGRLRNLQDDLKQTTKLDGVVNDSEEKQQCSSLWRLLCKQMEDNERNHTLSEEQDEEESKEDKNVETYQTEAVELLGEVIDGISQDQNLIQGETKQKIETLEVSPMKINRWSSLKRVILLRRFVKALENVRKFNPREPRFLPLEPGVEAEKVNLRHQETQNKRNGEEWMVDNALQGVVSKLTPARRLKVQLLVQAFETLSATGN